MLAIRPGFPQGLDDPVVHGKAEGIRREWVALFGDKPVAGGQRELVWPAGFLLPDPSKTVKPLTGARGMAYALEVHWGIGKWEMRVEPTASGAHTKLTFDADVEFGGNMRIHQHEDSQKAAAEWFFEYVNKPCTRA